VTTIENDAYWTAYNAVRQDKKCGKSYIPDDAECHIGKGKSGGKEKLGLAAAGAKSKARSGASVPKKHGLNKDLRNAAMIAAAGTATGAAALGTAVGTINHDVKASEIAKDVPTLRRPADGMPDDETRATYDKFEPGQMIRKMFFQPGAKDIRRYHYGVYVGKNDKGVHEMIEVTMGPDGVKGPDTRPRIVRSGLDGQIEENGTQFESVPKEEMYLKKGTKEYSPEEVVKRAESLVGRNFTWNGFESNCESLARAITEGKAYATQADRVSAFTSSASKVVGAAAASFDPKNATQKFNDYLLDDTKLSAKEIEYTLNGAPNQKIERKLRNKRKQHRHRQKKKQLATAGRADNTDSLWVLDAMEPTPENQQMAVDVIVSKITEFEKQFAELDVTGDLLTHLYKAQFMQLLLAAGVKIDDPR